MRRGFIGVLFFILLSALFFANRSVDAQQGRGVSWIWFNEGDPATSAPAEARYFRRAFDLARPSDETTVDITADQSFVLYVNGQQVGKGSDPKRRQEHPGRRSEGQWRTVGPPDPRQLSTQRHVGGAAAK
jgi:hypothetical protein